MEHEDFGYKQFDENFHRFGDDKAEPEKFNLYSGLCDLAKGCQNLAAGVQALQDEVDSLKKRLP